MHKKEPAVGGEGGARELIKRVRELAAGKQDAAAVEIHRTEYAVARTGWKEGRKKDRARHG